MHTEDEYQQLCKSYKQDNSMGTNGLRTTPQINSNWLGLVRIQWSAELIFVFKPYNMIGL